MQMSGSQDQRRFFSPEYLAEHPDFGESLLPVWGSAREAIADVYDGDYAGATLNGALAASDLFLLKSLATGGVKTARYFAMLAEKKARKDHPEHWKRIVRPWMGDRGYLQPRQIGHHWFFPENSKAPNWLKNHHANIQPMPSRPVHNSIHGQFGRPQYPPLKRYKEAVPTWAKVQQGAVVGDAIGTAKSYSDRKTGR
jgi:hypothetical protein